MNDMQRKGITKGFTLLEMMLVMAIMSTIFALLASYTSQKFDQMRRERCAMQMQQLLNASLSYYLANGKWPGSDIPTGLADLQTAGLVPASLPNPWGQTYTVQAFSKTNVMYVSTTTGYSASTIAVKKLNAQLVASMLPLSFITTAVAAVADATKPPTAVACDAVDTDCPIVVAQVNVPGMNLNNARSINFAGLYHYSECVPVPTCPNDALGVPMTPSIYVVPSSISGFNDTGSTIAYPITSFTAYATGGKNAGLSPEACRPPGDKAGKTAGMTTCPAELPAGDYWRVCAQIVTSQNDINMTNAGGDERAPTNKSNTLGQASVLAAFTRCTPTTENQGSALTLWGY
jgi:prepilin-type N-terminal cleavage/methylation domain-containing protein